MRGLKTLTMNDENVLGVPDAEPSVGLFAAPLRSGPPDQAATIPHAPPRKLILRIYGSDGVEIREGDWVKTSTHAAPGFRGGFYTRVMIHNGGIYPFSHFSYARIVKVDGLPDGVLPMRGRDEGWNELPEAWYAPHDEYFPEEGNTEENRANWKLESMEFEGRGFYRVELDQTTKPKDP